jgi:hypothetical protein
MKYLLLSLLSFIGLYSNAQVTWSEGAMYINQGPRLDRMVKGYQDEVIAISFKNNPYNGWRPITPVATRYDKRLQPVLEKELFTTGENVHFHSAYNFREHVYLFTTWYNRSEKATILYCTEIDPQTLEVKYQKEINRFDAVDRFRQFDIQIKPSRDTSHILIFSGAQYPDRKPGKVVVQVLGPDMKNNWGKVINLPQARKFISFESVDISNTGDVYILYRHYKQEMVRERMDLRVRRSNQFTCKVLVCNDSVHYEYVPDVHNKIVHDVTLHIDDGVYLLGLYRDKFRGRVTGHFNIEMNTGLNRFEPFPVDDVLKKMETDRSGSTNPANPGLSSFFKIIGTNLRQDSSVDLITEENYHYTESDSTSNKEQYVANDILVINYKKDGVVYYTRIPKLQEEEDHYVFISFKWMNRGNELLLFYNDVAENINKELYKRPTRMYGARTAGFVQATVGATGQLKREILYDHKQMDFVTYIKTSEVFNNQALALYAERYRMFRKSSFRLGKLTLYNAQAIQ